ncbi:unnamed protein product, partial [Mesorhabditis belari]|uniref:Uncharacterized protein n=1 Tax=Mesorhabditis belari TaxID=2138241 RepID=A0AAF3FKL5_9BILA
MGKVFYLRCYGKRFAKQSFEFNLLFIGLANLFVQLALMFWIDWGTVLFDSTAQLLALNLASDCSTLSEAYIGLIVNAKLRRAFFEWIFPSPSSIKISSSNQKSITVTNVTNVNF